MSRIHDTVSLVSATENEKMCVIFVAGNRKACNLFLIIFFLRRVKKTHSSKITVRTKRKGVAASRNFLLVLDFDVKPLSGSQIVQCRHDAGK